MVLSCSRLIAGEGFAIFGLLAAALVICANTALRPIVHAINRQPVDTIEDEQRYLVAIDCRATIASDVRAMLVRQFADVPEIHFTKVDSTFNEDGSRVEVTAIVTSQNNKPRMRSSLSI